VAEFGRARWRNSGGLGGGIREGSVAEFGRARWRSWRRAPWRSRGAGFVAKSGWVQRRLLGVGCFGLLARAGTVVKELGVKRGGGRARRRESEAGSCDVGSEWVVMEAGLMVGLPSWAAG
jgi:hypothetical protein